MKSPYQRIAIASRISSLFSSNFYTFRISRLHIRSHAGIHGRFWSLANPFFIIFFGYEDGENQSQKKERSPKVCGPLLEDAGGLCAKHLICHSRAKSRSQTLLFGALHKYHQNEQSAHHDKGNKQ